MRSVDALCADGLRFLLYEHLWLIHRNSSLIAFSYKCLDEQTRSMFKRNI